jgi:hypothetical protein
MNAHHPVQQAPKLTGANLAEFSTLDVGVLVYHAQLQLIIKTA